MVALRWITVKQTSAWLQVMPWKVRELLNKGEIPGKRPIDTVGATPWAVDSERLQEKLETGWRPE